MCVSRSNENWHGVALEDVSRGKVTPWTVVMAPIL